MNRLRLLIISFILILTFFFNVERLDFGSERNIINIDTFVYFLAISAIVFTMAVRLFRQFELWLTISFWLSLFLLIKEVLYLWFGGRPLVGGINTYLSITEMVLLAILIAISYRLSNVVDNFERAVEDMTFLKSDSGRIKQLKEANNEIELEMFRSRQYNHPLSVIVVKPHADEVQAALHEAVQEVQKTMMTAYVINNMARMLSRHLRRTDLILEERYEGRFVVFCPETDREILDDLVKHIENVAENDIGIKVTCGTATFPDQAFTFEDLLSEATTQLRPSVSAPQREYVSDG